MFVIGFVVPSDQNKVGQFEILLLFADQLYQIPYPLYLTFADETV